MTERAKCALDLYHLNNLNILNCNMINPPWSSWKTCEQRLSSPLCLTAATSISCRCVAQTEQCPAKTWHPLGHPFWRGCIQTMNTSGASFFKAVYKQWTAQGFNSLYFETLIYKMFWSVLLISDMALDSFLNPRRDETNLSTQYKARSKSYMSGKIPMFFGCF